MDTQQIYSEEKFLYAVQLGYSLFQKKQNPVHDLKTQAICSSIFSCSDYQSLSITYQTAFFLPHSINRTSEESEEFVK